MSALCICKNTESVYIQKLPDIEMCAAQISQWKTDIRKKIQINNTEEGCQIL